MSDTSQKIKADKNDISSLIELDDRKAAEGLVEFAQKFDDSSLNKIPLSFWAKMDFDDLRNICLGACGTGLAALRDKCLAIMSLHDPQDCIILSYWQFLASFAPQGQAWIDPIVMVKANEQLLKGSSSLGDILQIVSRSFDWDEYSHLRDQAFLKYLSLAADIPQILALLQAGVCCHGHFTSSEKKIFWEKLIATAKILSDWSMILCTLAEDQGRLLEKKDCWVYAMEQICQLADTATESELRAVLKAITHTKFHVFPKKDEE